MINPVLRRELQTKLRTIKSPILLSVYLSILAAFGGLAVLAITSSSYHDFNPQSALEIYATLTGCQLVLITMLAPSLTAGTISGERERQTLDLLLITKLSPFSIIIGKLLASVSQMILLIVASMPILSVIFVFGGVSLEDLFILFIFFVATVVTIGSIGIFCSTYFKKTTTSTVVSYFFILMLTVGTIIGLGVGNMLSYSARSSGLTYGEGLLIIGANPFIGFLSIMESQLGIGMIGGIMNRYNNYGMISLNPWQINLIFDVVISIIMIRLSVLKIRPVKGKKR